MKNIHVIFYCLIIFLLSNCARQHFSTITRKEDGDCYIDNNMLSSQNLCINLKDSSFIYTIQRSLMSPVACGRIISYNDSLFRLSLDEQKTKVYISENPDQGYILFPNFEALKFDKDSNLVRVLMPLDTKTDTSLVEYYLFKQ